MPVLCRWWSLDKKEIMDLLRFFLLFQHGVCVCVVVCERERERERQRKEERKIEQAQSSEVGGSYSLCCYQLRV